LKVVDPIKIEQANIKSIGKYYTTMNIAREGDTYWQKFKMYFKLSKKPIVVGIKSLSTGKVYYLTKGGHGSHTTPDFVTKMNYNSDNTEWTLEFKIKQTNKTQNKTFRLFVQDYRAKNET
jgi:hypothetical protein